MKTTVDLPDDLYRRTESLARNTSRSIDETGTEILAAAVGLEARRAPTLRPRAGLPIVSVGRPISAEDVSSLEDDE